MTVAIIYREEIKEYDFGLGHPLRGTRFPQFYKYLLSQLPEGDFYRIIPAEPATEADLLKICTKDYIEFNQDYFRKINLNRHHDDRFFQYHSADNMPHTNPGKLEEAARLIVGQAKLAADLVMSGNYAKAISIGGGTHHAKRSFGEGFCIYNDIAFVAHYLIEKHGLEKVLVLDTDAHAGNGTEDYFYGSRKVLFIDVQQNPATIYPGTGYANDIGTGEGTGFTINVPIPLRAGYEAYRMVFEEIIEPVTAEFQPQIIIRNGGSDPHFADGLTELGLTVAGFKMLGEKVKGLAELCGGREIDLIASGYNAEVLPCCWLAMISGLADFPVAPVEIIPVPETVKPDSAIGRTREIIKDVKNYLGDYWHCLKT
jgi:acetoin utilization protein AcuC